MIKELIKEEYAPGVYRVIFDSEGLSSGIYSYTLNATYVEDGKELKFQETKQMVLVK